MLRFFDAELGSGHRKISTGDIVVFWIEPKLRRPQHVGIASENNSGERTVIHAFADHHMVTESDWGECAMEQRETSKVGILTNCDGGWCNLPTLSTHCDHGCWAGRKREKVQM